MIGSSVRRRRQGGCTLLKRPMGPGPIDGVHQGSPPNVTTLPFLLWVLNSRFRILRRRAKDESEKSGNSDPGTA